MKLALKFTLWFTLGVFVVSGVAGYVRINREIGLFEREIRRDHEATGVDLAAAVETIWRLAGEEAALAYVDKVNESKSHVLVRWIWPEVAPDSPAGPRAGRDRIARLERRGDIVRARIKEGGCDWACTYVASVTPRGRFGALELCESLEEEKKYIRTTVIRTTTVTLVIVLLCGLFTMGLGALVVGRPVRQLIHKARRVATGDLSGQLDISQHDELGQLAAELNAMSEQLGEAQQRLIAEVSARRATTEQLRHADRLTMVGKLASGIAHELGTPLNIILARARMIAEESSVDQRTAEFAAIIADQATRMSSAIRQLLNYARRQAPNKSPTDLRSVIRQAAGLLEPAARRANVHMKTELPEEPAAALVDPGQIGQVLSNLVLNGIQAMPEGGVLTMGIELASTKDMVPGEEPGLHMLSLFVRDQGVGIPPDDLTHLFEPFFTSRAAEGGTGLGLSIAADIVQEHGGRIEVRTEVGRGTCFYVYLPVETSPCPAAS